MKFEVKPLGFVISEDKESSKKDMQKPGGNNREVCIEILDEYKAALDDVDGFEYVYILFIFHKNNKEKLKTKPLFIDEEKGIFATRSPSRPNHIGLSTVKVLRREDNKLFITNADMIHGTPIIDIKPYVPDIDAPSQEMSGWIKGVDRFK